MQVITIIVTYNSIKTITGCLDSVVNQRNNKIFVIDNGSIDGTVDLINKNYTEVEIFKLQKNLGFAGGNNFGIDKALERSCDYIFILNPDTIIKPDALNKLVEFAERKSNQGIFGPKILRPDGKVWSEGGTLDNKRFTAKLIGFGSVNKTQYSDPRICEFISGTCMLIPVKLLKKGLRFYEPYFLYYEDVEFCIKAGSLGFPSFVFSEAEIVHLETSGGKIKYYYLARNHLLFVERNAPFGVKLHEVTRLPKTVYEHYKKNDKFALAGIKDYLNRKFGMKEHEKSR